MTISLWKARTGSGGVNQAALEFSVLLPQSPVPGSQDYTRHLRKDQKGWEWPVGWDHIWAARSLSVSLPAH